MAIIDKVKYYFIRGNTYYLEHIELVSICSRAKKDPHLAGRE